MKACLLNRVTLANSSFGSVVWKDVRLVDCDLANFETRGLSLTRVEFINCRMTGFRAGEADFYGTDLSGALIRRCDRLLA